MLHPLNLKGINKGTLAGAIGVDPQQLSSVTDGVRDFSLQLAHKAAPYFGHPYALYLENHVKNSAVRRCSRRVAVDLPFVARSASASYHDLLGGSHPINQMIDRRCMSVVNLAFEHVRRGETRGPLVLGDQESGIPLVSRPHLVPRVAKMKARV